MRPAPLVALVLASSCSFESAVERYCSGKFGRSCPDLADFAASGLDWAVPARDAFAGECVPVRVLVQSKSGFLLAPDGSGFTVNVSVDYPANAGLYSSASCTTQIAKVRVAQQDAGQDVFFKSDGFNANYFGKFGLIAAIPDAGLSSPIRPIHALAWVRPSPTTLPVRQQLDGGGGCATKLPLSLLATDVEGNPARSIGEGVRVQLTTAEGAWLLEVNDGGACSSSVASTTSVDWPYSAGDQLTFDLNVMPVGSTQVQTLLIGGPHVRADAGIPIN